MRVWLDASIARGKLAREQAPPTITLRAEFAPEGNVVAVRPACLLPNAVAEWLPILEQFGLEHAPGRSCTATVEWDTTSSPRDDDQK